MDLLPQYPCPLPEGAQHLCLRLPHMTLAAVAWGTPDGSPLLALHGWLDNAASFSVLGPKLAAAGYYVVAPDLPGHGYSDWRPTGQPYVLMTQCFEVQAIAAVLGWHRFTLLGHSMGAGIASLYAGSCPQQIIRLVLIDGIGTLVSADEQAPQQLQQSLLDWQQYTDRKAAAKSGRSYASPAQAAQARTRGVAPLDYEAALLLCQRGLMSFIRRDSRNRLTRAWRWRSDPRLLLASPWRLNEAQNLAFLKAIDAPVLFVGAKQGLLVDRPEMPERLAAVRQLQMHDLAGGHHLHLEQRSAAMTASVILDFLQST